MTTPDDAYWDELGVAWRAVKPEINVVAPRLKTRLRCQTFLITASLVTGLPVCAAGLLLGGFTIWSGWTTGAWNFVTRGFAIGAVSAMLAIALSWLLPVRASDCARALSDMIDLAVARAQRLLITIRLGLYACVIMAVLGLAGTAIRTHLTRPPRMSPMVDLAVLAVFALGLYFYGRRIGANIGKLRALRHALASDGGT